MIWNAFVLAVRTVRRNKMRSALTILGIVIGVAAVIVMVTLGKGATAQVTSQIASMGTNMLMIAPGQRPGPGQSAPPFRVEDAEALAAGVPSLAAVSPTAQQSATAVYGNENWNTSVAGVDNAYFVVRHWPLAAGRTFTDGEVRAGAAVAVLGNTVRTKLFGGQDPIGQNVRLGNVSAQVIGVLTAKGQAGMGDQDDTVLMPLRTVQRRFTGNREIRMIQVSVKDGVSTATAQAEIEQVMRGRRHITGVKEDDFHVMDMKELATMLTGTTQLLTMLLSAVAAVSLLVGGIGIMNIMLVSVTERTREIGIRLAIGATQDEVLTQFLVEAVALSSFGGLVGIALALAASFALAGVLGVPFILDGSVVAIAFLFSAAVGMVFGYFPARKAARLDPIDALRYE
ncbi:MAG: ABC transporter permease [Vicinamibacteria bacterium]